VFVTVFVLAVFCWLGARIWRDIGNVEWSTVELRPGLLALAMAVLAFAYLLRASVWAVLVRLCGTPVALTSGIRVFLLTFAGRYLPGKIWQFVGAGVLGARYAIPATTSVGTTMLGVLIHESMGLVIGFALIGPMLGYPHWVYGVAIAGIVAVLVLLCSPLLPWMLKLVARRTKRTLPELRPLRFAHAAALVAVYAAVWGLFGVGFWCLAHGVLPVEAAQLDVVTATGAITSACVLGFFAVFAPSGLGVREAILAVVLDPVVGAGGAALLAVLARVWMTLVEFLLMGWAAMPFVTTSRNITPTRTGK
jgi:hypothetical protein